MRGGILSRLRSWLFGPALVGALVVSASPAAADPNNNNSQKLRSAVTLAGVREHQAALQAIADANNGTRLQEAPAMSPRRSTWRIG
jgi:hypothetical protein